MVQDSCTVYIKLE